MSGREGSSVEKKVVDWGICVGKKCRYPSHHRPSHHGARSRPSSEVNRDRDMRASAPAVGRGSTRGGHAYRSSSPRDSSRGRSDSGRETQRTSSNRGHSREGRTYSPRRPGSSRDLSGGSRDQRQSTSNSRDRRRSPGRHNDSRRPGSSSGRHGGGSRDGSVSDGRRHGLDNLRRPLVDGDYCDTRPEAGESQVDDGGDSGSDGLPRDGRLRSVVRRVGSPVASPDVGGRPIDGAADPPPVGDLRDHLRRRQGGTPVEDEAVVTATNVVHGGVPVEDGGSSPEVVEVEAASVDGPPGMLGTLPPSAFLPTTNCVHEPTVDDISDALRGRVDKQEDLHELVNEVLAKYYNQRPGPGRSGRRRRRRRAAASRVTESMLQNCRPAGISDSDDPGPESELSTAVDAGTVDEGAFASSRGTSGAPSVAGANASGSPGSWDFEKSSGESGSYPTLAFRRNAEMAGAARPLARQFVRRVTYSACGRHVSVYRTCPGTSPNDGENLNLCGNPVVDGIVVYVEPPIWDKPAHSRYEEDVALHRRMDADCHRQYEAQGEAFYTSSVLRKCKARAERDYKIILAQLDDWIVREQQKYLLYSKRAVESGQVEWDGEPVGVALRKMQRQTVARCQDWEAEKKVFWELLVNLFQGRNCAWAKYLPDSAHQRLLPPDLLKYYRSRDVVGKYGHKVPE